MFALQCNVYLLNSAARMRHKESSAARRWQLPIVSIIRTEASARRALWRRDTSSAQSTASKRRRKQANTFTLGLFFNFALRERERKSESLANFSGAQTNKNNDLSKVKFNRETTMTRALLANEM